MPSQSGLPGGTTQSTSGIERALRTLVVMVGAGILGIVAYAIHFSSWQSALSIATIATMIGAASLVVGGLLGFLFGIPRAVQRDAEPDETLVTDPTARNLVVGVYLANTNLEKISDWLTTIIVGIVLIQLNEVLGVLERLAISLRPALGNEDGSGIFGVATALFFLVCGFLLAYLWTRVYLPRAFRWSDAFAELAKRVDALSRQAEGNALELEVLTQQSSRRSDAAAVDEQEEDRLKREASDATRS